MRLTSTILSAASAALILSAAPHAQPRAATPLTIEQLIDIKHPSNPVWSRDSRRIAFTWERAGVANLYVVPADGSARPVQVTTDGVPANIFWSPDSASILFFRGATLMALPLDGGAAKPRLTDFAGRSPSVSRDGTRIVYLAGGAGGGRGGRGGGRGRPPSPAAAEPATAGQAAVGADLPAPPTEVRIRSLVNDADTLVATVTEPIATVSWINDTQLALSAGGGGGQTIRHEQTPDYSGAKIIYTVTERTAGAPAGTYVLPVSGGMPVKYSAGGGGFGGRGGNRWIDATHFLVDRQTPDFKRRTISVGSVSGGEPRLVHEDVKETFWSMTGDARGGSQASPDGKWISFVSDKDGWDHLYVAPAAGGAPVQVTKGQYEAWRSSWSPDGTRIAFDSNEGSNPGSRQVRVVTLNGDPARASIAAVTKGRGTNTDAQWSPSGTLLVYQHTDPQNSADLYVVDVSKPGAAPVRLTDSMPAAIDKSALVEPQLVHYAGPDGKQVPAYLFVPKNLDRSRKHPAIVWVHGDGVNQNYDGWHVQRNYAVYYSFHQYLLQQGYVVLAPDYRGSIGYGSAWREGVYMDVGGHDFKDAAMSADYLKTLPYVDADRLGIWGLSYGGFFTLLAVTERPTAFRAAVDVAGVADYAMYYDDPYHGTWTASRIGTPDQNPKVYAQASPVSHIDRLVRPLLVLHGTADVNVPYLHSVRLIDAALKASKGSLVEFMTYPGEFHYFTREHVLRDAWTRVDGFFAKWLKPDRGPAGSR
jgi:dipeptidyl aminopeptidase/acylaminoacyl peptidase